MEQLQVEVGRVQQLARLHDPPEQLEPEQLDPEPELLVPEEVHMGPNPTLLRVQALLNPLGPRPWLT